MDCDLLKFTQRAHIAAPMVVNDGFGTRRAAGRQQCRVKHAGVRIDVAPHGLCAQIGNGHGGGETGQRGEYDVVTGRDPAESKGDGERAGAIAGGHAVGITDELAELVLEGFYFGAGGELS